MKTLDLDGRGWRTKDDFYNALFEAVGAPSWHGRNLDAPNDSIGAGNINKIEVPYQIRIKGVSKMQPEPRGIVLRFADLINELRGDGCEVHLELLE